MISLAESIKTECIRRLQENKEKITTSINQLSESTVWEKPNASSNSMGNIIVHLCGNITQYIISTLGGQEDLRQRSKEFEMQPGITKDLALLRLNEVIEKACAIISSLTIAELEKSYPVQCYVESGTGIIVHVTEHASYHTGQIVYFTKMKLDKRMAFYDESALESHGKSSIKN